MRALKWNHGQLYAVIVQLMCTHHIRRLDNLQVVKKFINSWQYTNLYLLSLLKFLNLYYGNIIWDYYYFTVINTIKTHVTHLDVFRLPEEAGKLNFVQLNYRLMKKL